MSLKLLALDAEDLCVISAHLQDAAVQARDMAWIAAAKRFALVCRRPDHVAGSGVVPSGLHFDHVLKVERLRIPAEENAALTLIGLGFETTEAPSGHVTLLFNGGAAIRLTVDCIEATMRDLTPPAPAGG
jgi:hypothetical protein